MEFNEAISCLEQEKITKDNAHEFIDGLDGVLVGPGFGSRGIEGKINAIEYVREHKIPFFGICLGMQCAVIEFARNVCGIEDANSAEFNPESHCVIDLMESQKQVKDKGGTMRLGAYPCKVQADTKAFEAYKEVDISERHRHRYELNNEYRDILAKNGMVFSGLSPDGELVEISELKDHPWFIGVQFHPELKSRAVTGTPLFISFIKAALKYHNAKNK